MASGTMKAPATIPTITAFSSTFTRMPPTLQFRHPERDAARQRPAHHEALCSAKYGDRGSGCQPASFEVLRSRYQLRHEADGSPRERLRDRAASLGLLGLCLEFRIRDSRNRSFGRQRDLGDREGFSLALEAHGGGGVYMARRVTCRSKARCERHREASGMGGPEKLLGICVLAVFEPIPKRIRSLERSALQFQPAPAFPEVPIPLCLGAAIRHFTHLLSSLECAFDAQCGASSVRTEAFAAAAMMTAATAFGCESIGTWLVFNSVVVAFMRFAKKRSSSGAIAPSSFDTMYHDGFIFHAAADTWAAKAEALIGPCVAATTRASAGGRSDAKCLTTASVDRLKKPCLSTMGAASAGGGG